MTLLSFRVLESLIKSDDSSDIRLGLVACINTKVAAGQEVIPVDWIYPFIESSVPEFSRLAIEALNGKDVPLKEVSE